MLFVDAVDIFGAGFSVEEAALFYRAASLHAGMVLMREQHVANAVGAVDRAREVGDVLGDRVLAAHGSGVDAVAFACYRAVSDPGPGGNSHPPVEDRYPKMNMPISRRTCIDLFVLPAVGARLCERQRP